MGLNDTPVANRVHIGFFGRRNAGKSSLVNAVTGQTVSVVSDVAGTTTDPVTKTMELLPLGPVVLIDTPGYDDAGSLGEMRVARTKLILNRADIAVLVVDGSVGMTACDYELLDIFRAKDIPFLIAFDKADLAQAEIPADLTDAAVRVSAASGAGLHAFKERLAHLRPAEAARPLVADLVPRDRRATAYGVFAAVQGAGALIGGIGAGFLYDQSLTALVAVIAAVQVAAFGVLVPVVRRARTAAA